MEPPAFASGTSWSWPEEDLGSGACVEAPPGSIPSSEWETDHEEDVQPQQEHKNRTPPKAQKHYATRTCRICLEVVLPTYETPSEGLLGMLSPSPAVTYISEDPASGRFIRPCKCKGSQRYVHEGCLQEWRFSDPGLRSRTYWECPTCKFRYRLERMKWSRWISSSLTQILLTFLILFAAIFVLGFIGDPIISLYLDPLETLTTNPFSSRIQDNIPDSEDEMPIWLEHIIKGLASLGLLGFAKVIFALGPWDWYNLRNRGILGGGTGRARNGRDRLAAINWSLVILGVMTFFWAVWKGVRAWSRNTLQKAGERVADVQGEDDDDIDEDAQAGAAAGGIDPK